MRAHRTATRRLAAWAATLLPVVVACLALAPSASALSILGTSSHDSLFGTLGADNIVGLAGVDAIFGSFGNDVISGGFDADTLSGDVDNDQVSGNSGADYVLGGFGADNVTVLRNKGSANFTEPASSPEAAGDDPISVTAADLDGDGHRDLAVANQFSDNVTILVNFNF